MSDTTQQKPTPTTPAGWWPDVNQPGWDRYWNGWSWENATRRTPGAQPTVARTTFVKPKRSIWPWVAGGSAVGVFLIGAVVVFIIIAIAIVASAASGASQKVQLSDDKPAAVTEPTKEPVKEKPVKKEPAPAPVAPLPEAGTLANPYPLGHALGVQNMVTHKAQYTVSARMIDGDAWNVLYATNMFNDEAPAGMKYILMEYTINALSEDKPVMPGAASLAWNLADADGALYNYESVVTPGESMMGAPDLYAGQTFVGQIAYLVPADNRPLFFSAYGGYVAL